VIYGAKVGPDNRRLIFENPLSTGRCEGVRDVDSSIEDIDAGVELRCTINTGTGCSGTSSCINTEHINLDINQEDVLEDMRQRLVQDTHCAIPEDPSAPEQAFQEAFGNGDGDPSTAPAPPALGGTATPSHVYVQNDCYDNPRIVVLPIVSSSRDDPTRSEPVLGFATVYITGCYLDNNAGTAEARESNTCGEDDCWFNGDPGDVNDSRPDDCLDLCPGACPPSGSNADDRCFIPNPHTGCFVEIRAIPVHMFIIEGSLGGITAPTNNAPLTIQTVQ
jgi:hypothetical protein